MLLDVSAIAIAVQPSMHHRARVERGRLREGFFALRIIMPAHA
jgi:hypothetical protein